MPAAKERGDRGRGTSAFEMVLSPGAGRASAGGCILCHLSALPSPFILPPSPRPALAERSSPPGKGETLGYFMQGAPPLASPRLNPWLPQKRQEAVPYEQCRQPRRGGTGGDGTIRRKRRRRLRWSSPPGQGEQVPPGAPPLASPRRNRKRHGLNLRCRCHGGGKTRAALAVSAASGSFFRNGHEPWLRQ